MVQIFQFGCDCVTVSFPLRDNSIPTIYTQASLDSHVYKNMFEKQDDHIPNITRQSY